MSPQAGRSKGIFESTPLIRLVRTCPFRYLRTEGFASLEKAEKLRNKSVALRICDPYDELNNFASTCSQLLKFGCQVQSTVGSRRSPLYFATVSRSGTERTGAVFVGERNRKNVLCSNLKYEELRSIFNRKNGMW